MTAPTCQCEALTTEDIFDLVFPHEMEVGGYLCMVYNCFLDDSKDHDQTKVMVSAGFFGTKEDWGSLRLSWQKILNNHNMEYFKSSEYYHLKGQFEQFKKHPKPKGREAAQEVRKELQAVLERHPNIHGVGVLILLEDYYKALSRPEAQGVLPQNPYHTALNSVMYETVRMVKSRPGHNMVAFVHDDGPDYDSLRSSYEHFRKGNPKTAKVLGGFLPLDDRIHPPLQAADMVSNYAMQRGVDALQKSDDSLKTIFEEMTVNVKKVGYWDEDYILYALKTLLKKGGKTIPLDLLTEKYD